MSELDGPEIVALTRAIALDPHHASLRWQAVSLVAVRMPSTSTLRDVRGFVYLDDGTWQLARTRVEDVADAFDDITRSGQGESTWICCLFQVARPSGMTRLLFEDEDDERWPIDPEGSDAQAEWLRPEFG